MTAPPFYLTIIQVVTWKSSRAFQELTAKINEAAKYHDIKLLDHIIVTREGYYFFADEEASRRDEFKK